MQVPDKVAKILERMSELASKMHADEDLPEEAYAEYRCHLDTAKAALMPLVQAMVDAGLFTLEVGPRSYEVAQVYDNGNFWLVAGEATGETLKA